MKRKVSKLRLSPNEEARIIREEHERRRKLRIQQVREQQKYIALQICREVEHRRQYELRQLQEKLREDWELQQREKLHTLQRLYQESLQLLGQGHRSAKENEPDLAAIAQRKEENHAKAEERYREALKELKTQRIKDHERQSHSINARKKALQAEKERSAKVASLPPPPLNITQNIDTKKPHVVKRFDVSAFAATHYHMPERTVDREEDTAHANAHEEAELEARRLQDLQREEKRKREEHLEKARLRGRQALRREQLVQDRERLLVELEHMQQTDMLRRRQQVSQMPPQIFQPLYKRQETREDFQREMEFAFEDMYTGERRVKGDLVVKLVPEPLPDPSTGSQDQELDVTLDEPAFSGTENVRYDTEQETSAEGEEGEASRPAPRRVLRKLLDRIRNQRNEWTNHSSHVPAADSPTVYTDQIPERETTIETGSLLSEEKDKRTPDKLREPCVLSPVVEPTKQPAAADTLSPDVFLTRTQEFEEERRKREEELEREKQQQMLLLQELEEQKAKLEQMLLEAQQERDHLKVVNEEVNQPEIPVHDQKVTSGSTTDLVPPAAKDDHTRRIMEYQQRLLEQNRIHQRSVEVARQRLEEYQQALRIRYSMTARSLLPPVVPPGLVHSPPHRMQSEQVPAHLKLPKPPVVPAYAHNGPQVSVEVASRDSDVLASPPCHASSASTGSKLLSDESVSNTLRTLRPNVTAQLTDSVMERVTEQLPERLRPSLTKEQLFPRHHTASVPLQPKPVSLRTISPSIIDSAPPDPGLQSGSSNFTAADMKRQKQELQDIRRRVLEQKEAVVLQQKLQEEERQRHEEQRQRREMEMEQMRRQKETLQALVNTQQPVSHVPSEVSVSEDIGQRRMKLLASLLKAIEESNGGSLSHLENSDERDNSFQQIQSDSGETAPAAQINVPPRPSILPSGLHLPCAPKPPVTRLRLGVQGVMTEQHELSAIQEVETPVNTSQVTGPENNVAAPSHTPHWDLQEFSDTSMTSNKTLQTSSVSSSGQETAERRVSSERSSHFVWKERLLSGTGTCPELSDSDSVLKATSLVSSDSGRGADFSGPALTSYRSFIESPHRPPGSDCLSSTTVSTGSYITTDPEQNANTDKSPHVAEQGSGPLLSNAPSPFEESTDNEESLVSSRPSLSVDLLVNDSSIQHIIDRYTRELNLSLSTAGKTTVSQQTLVQDSERGVDGSPAGHQSLVLHTAGTQQSAPEFDFTVPQHISLVEDQDHDTFQPLIGQLTDQSSCLIADQRDSALEQLVGQPSTHSSMIGHQPGPQLSLSFDQGGWNSALSRMIARVSHQSSSHWMSTGRDFYAAQLIDQNVSEPSWLAETPERIRMRPLVGELDQSAVQHTGRSGERSYMALGVSAEASVPLNQMLASEASSHYPSVSDVNPHLQDRTRQTQISLVDLGSQGVEDSFHPLLAEVTHNETADPSMIFQMPGHGAPDTPEAHPASREHRVSTPSAESETHTDPSVESETSPEHFRTEEPNHFTAPPTLHGSMSQLIISECHRHDSALEMSPAGRTDVDKTTLILSNLTIGENVADVGRSKAETRISNMQEGSLSFSDSCAQEVTLEREENLRNAFPASDKILEGAMEKGILEQSEITLVSLTDTTLQEQETTITEEEEDKEIKGEKLPDGFREKRREPQETEGLESMSLPEKTPEDDCLTHPVTLLEFQWGSSRGLQDIFQQKRGALLQKSNLRVEEIKAKRVLAKSQCENKVPSKGIKQAKGAQQVTCKAKTMPELQLKTHKSKREKAAQRESQLPPPESDSSLKKEDEVKICTTEQRKLKLSEMHQRTQRLYEQLEEVKHQRSIRSRQEDYAKNRLKAKEFHKKTLQKLHAKQTR
ncbi:centrosomal protein of 295 kDa isoform X3 [Melanotaenia boesemani]|uniref:centrosomal protein of 295 kDa isoform X3 n=1 Tax=Melanotaenia boesemani TaxID=1250792 RepID=UPI001C043358|nr:centrosomal protein of 295 kDa isoform X3 [Melanotaenia boesemani]